MEKSKELESYILGRFTSVFETVEAFDKKLHNDHVKADDLIKKLRAAKESGLTVKELKKDLQEFVEANYNVNVLLQDYMKYVEILKELNSAITFFGVETDLSDEQKKFVDMISSSELKMFTFFNGNVEPIDEKQFNNYLESIATKVTTESLEEIFKTL